MLNFIVAESWHADLLRDTLIRSKGYWGYAAEQLERWRSNLTFTEEYISHNVVKLVQKEGAVIGFFAIVKGNADKGSELDHLWLLPEVIGQGYGNQVFAQILLESKGLGIAEFYIISDPDAVGFYLKKGAIKVGEVYSEPQNRMLPKLKYSISI